MNFHASVATGMDDKYVYVNDPLPNKHGGKVKYKKDEFLYAMYGVLAADLDNSTFTLVKKKQ